MKKINFIKKVTPLSADTFNKMQNNIEEEFSQVNSQLAHIAQNKMDKNTTDISIAQINKNLGKIDQTYLTDELLQQIAGNAPINATLAGRSLIGSEVNLKTITPELVSFIKQSKNLFNKETYNHAKVISSSNGELVDSVSFHTSDYIPVLPNTVYTRNSAAMCGFYDKNKNFISSVGTGRQVTTPPNCCYVRVSLPTNMLNTYQFEIGDTETAYEPYKIMMDETSNIKFTKSFIDKNFENNSISAEKTDLLEIGKNLFDKTKATPGYYVNYTNGLLQANASYYASDYIEVESNTDYSYNFEGQLAFYDINKKYISGIAGTGIIAERTLTTPINAKYARFSTKYPNEFQVEKGTKCTSYEPFGFYIKKAILPPIIKNDDFLLFLPSEICVAVGRTIELYNNQVSWCGNINNYHFRWDCEIGKALKRKFSVTGTIGNIGEYQLKLTVYDNNMKEVATSTSTLKIVSNILSVTKNILTIGDSLSNTTTTYKPTYAELRRLSNNKLNFIGTRGLVDGEKHEGRSGWSAASYLKNTTYSYEGEGLNPFYDGSRFNWNFYKTNTNLNPDAVDIWLGTNGISLDPTTNANNIKQIVDYIRQDDATIPIFVTFTLYRGNQNALGNQSGTDGYATNRGAWKLEEDRKVFNLMVKLYELLKDYSNLYFIPVSLCHDSEYNYGSVETPVNPRATQTELIPIEATHPQEQGYLQIADIKFSVYAKYLNS